jgi:hypothetical protein
MLRLNFIISNPWSDKFDAGWAWGGHFAGNKAWEFQAYRSNTVVEACFEFTRRQDHAGLKLEFGLFSFSFVAQIYDTRHWNYADKCWEVYDDKETILP